MSAYVGVGVGVEGGERGGYRMEKDDRRQIGC